MVVNYVRRMDEVVFSIIKMCDSLNGHLLLIF